jgi:hypothetical protein
MNNLARSVIVIVAPLAVVATAGAEQVDLAVVHRIRNEAFRNSKVMEHLFSMTDVNGPRLTGSPGFRKAADWAAASLKGWGAADARLETWGRFGRGWSLERFSAHLIEPTYAPLHGVPKAWTSGTAGPVEAEVVLAPVFGAKRSGEIYELATLEAGIRGYASAQKGKLQGRIVLLDPPHPLAPPTQATVDRFDDAKLAALAEAPNLAPLPLEWPLSSLPPEREEREKLTASLPVEIRADFGARRRRTLDILSAFLRDEGVVAALTADHRGSGGIVFAEGMRSGAPDAPVPPPTVVLAPESYARLARLVEKGVPVRVGLDVQVKFHDDAPDAFNVVAEIPGGRRREEVVMLGAHLDSWHAGTGATDNAAGCAVALEAMRILKALGLTMERTVRIALWSGEEQGLLGSRAYVKQHFADPFTMERKPEHARLAAYFNVDNGTGRIRGVYLQGNDMARPIFEAWLAPFKDLGATTLTLADTGGTDHKSFDAVGLPGFQFIQDAVDYDTRTHHSDLDVYDHAVAADLMQASAVLASFVYHAATRPEMLPRKPLPPPLPKPRATTP